MEGRTAIRDVDNKVLCNIFPRTMSGPGGSSIKRFKMCATR